MTEQQTTKKLIAEKQGLRLEFCETFDMPRIAASVCAFLNAKGGAILVGVNNSGKVKGIKNADAAETELSNFILNALIPEAPVSIAGETVDGKQILTVKVWDGAKPPYIFGDTIYVRHGSTTTKATPKEITSLVIERQTKELHWERQPALGVDMEDLDEEEIRKTIRLSKETGRGKLFKEKDIQKFLDYYGLCQSGEFTNAAVVLFGREPATILPQCRVRLTVFAGNKTSDNYSHDVFLEGNLFRNADRIFEYFQTNISQSSLFTEKSLRRTDFSFPSFALREGLMNCLIHRNYSNVSGTALIAFYRDRLEISNFGELPQPLKPADLADNHQSVPRNPDIAQICWLRGLMEKIGRGTNQMISDLNDKGFKKPHWTSSGGNTTLVFPGITVPAQEVNTVFNVALAILSGLLAQSVTESVINRLAQLVTIIADSKGKKIADLVKKLKVSERTIKDNLKTLTDEGMIIYEGSKKAGSYNLSKSLQNKLHKTSLR